MKGFETDHKHISFKVTFHGNLSLCKRPYVIKKVNLQSLYARIVVGTVSEGVKHKIIKLTDSPHYKYLKGDKTFYGEYLARYGKYVGYGIEHSIENFEKLISDKNGYLEDKYSSDYIICEKITSLFGHKSVIVDGFHRACILLHQGVTIIPVAYFLDKKPKELFQLDQYLNDYKDDFQEWYIPLEIKGRIIHERTYPNFVKRPEYYSNKERGKSKWDFIIKKHLPNLKGKIVCDIGCNNGLFSIFMAQMGAKKVNGFDRGENVVQPTNKNLPKQNIVQQAYFVKNLFALAGRKNLDRVNYYECDINKLDFSKLKYDLFFSSCVLYHFGEKKFEEIIKKISKNTPEVFLQTNLEHEGKLAKLANVSYQKKLLEKYGYKVMVYSPIDYNYPVLYGCKIKNNENNNDCA